MKYSFLLPIILVLSGCSNCPCPIKTLPSQDPPECSDCTPPPPEPTTVYVSYEIFNQDTVTKFCDFTMKMPSNPVYSGSYYYYYLEAGKNYGGYHVHWGAAPYTVTFRVGCWENRDTPEDQRIYQEDTMIFTTSTKVTWVNNASGVHLTGIEPTP